LKTTHKYIGGAGMLEWSSTGGINFVKVVKTMHAAYKAYRSAKTLKSVIN
jgi:hypothetical protein